MNEFNSRKREILEKIIPHFVNPTVYPMPKVSVADCAVLLSKSENKMVSSAALRKTEQNALEKMRRCLKKTYKINNLADIL